MSGLSQLRAKLPPRGSFRSAASVARSLGMKTHPRPRSACETTRRAVRVSRPSDERRVERARVCDRSAIVRSQSEIWHVMASMTSM